MEAEVYLQLANLAVDTKRDYFLHLDYATLYQPGDAYEQEYTWEDDLSDDEKKVTEVATAYRRNLRTAVTRLDLLGHTLAQVRTMYEHERTQPSKHPTPRPPDPPFDAIAESIRVIDVSSVRADHPRRGSESPWTQAATRLLSLLDGDPPTDDRNLLHGWYEIVITGLDPFSLLQILAQNPANLDLPVTWHPFFEIGQGFLSSEDDVEVGATRRHRFLIVTEGSSDTAVIQKALMRLRPHVDDFFDFIDMDKNYPLTGIGNLHNFYQGLLKIGILNSVLIIYDNDTVGTAKLAAAAQLAALPNIRILKLPDMASFENFSTVGPTGEQPANINGKAVSIECFLDLKWRADKPPRVRWTGYHAGSGQYQGELEDKQAYVKRFLSLEPSELATYDSTKLDTLLNSILAECAGIATARLNEEWMASFP